MAVSCSLSTEIDGLMFRCMVQGIGAPTRPDDRKLASHSGPGPSFSATCHLRYCTSYSEVNQARMEGENIMTVESESDTIQHMNLSILSVSPKCWVVLVKLLFCFNSHLSTGSQLVFSLTFTST